MLKNVTRIVTLLGIALTFVSAGSTTNRLIFEDLRPTYRASETVTFSVRSTYGQRVLLSCSVDELIGGKWQEVIGSIHNPKSKTTRLYDLKPGERIRLSLKPDGTPIAPPAGGSYGSSIYRLRAEVYDERTVEAEATKPWSLRPERTPRLETAVSEPFRVLARRPN